MSNHSQIGLDYVGITTPFYCHDGQGNFLFHKRSINCRDEHGRWDPGSGKLDHGLTIQENVLKEVLEEYCCQGVIETQIPAHDIFRELNGSQSHWIAIPHFVLVNPEEVKIGEPHKMDEIGWFKLTDMPQPLHTGFQYTFDTFRPYFDEYIR